MQPNREQLMEMIRGLLAAGGPLAAFLVNMGVDQDTVRVWLDLLTALLAIGPPVAALVWGYLSQSNRAKVQGIQSLPIADKVEAFATLATETKIQAVAEMPDVAAVVVKDDAAPAAADIAASPDHPKVVSQSEGVANAIVA